MKTIPISDLRSNLKQVLALVQEGGVVDITQRGKVIASIHPPQVSSGEEAFKKRLLSYKNGAISVNSDIVNAPLKEYDYVDDHDLSDLDLVTEPDE